MMITRLDAEVPSAADEIRRCLSKEFPAKQATINGKYLPAAKQFAAAHVHVGCQVHWEIFVYKDHKNESDGYWS
jgi:hypothetical protein